jgi:hypothetical protein
MTVPATMRALGLRGVTTSELTQAGESGAAPRRVWQATITDQLNQCINGFHLQVVAGAHILARRAGFVR